MSGAFKKVKGEVAGYSVIPAWSSALFLIGWILVATATDACFCSTDKRPAYDEEDSSSLHSCHDDHSFSSRSIGYGMYPLC